jgi:flagellar basal-body rod modification protein FlgD
MLVAQLKNQNPLNPMDGTGFAAQLAQFSSLEQLTNMNEGIKSLGLYQMSMTNTQAVSLLGREVTVNQGNTLSADGPSVDLTYDLAGDAKQVTLIIYDQQGNFVKTIEKTDQKSGVNTMTWNRGDAPAGQYSFKVTAKDASGNDVSVATKMTGKVTGVHFKDKTIYLTVNGQDIAFDNVTNVK